MAATSKTLSYNALLTTTAEAYYRAGIVQEAVFESSPTVKMLKDSGFRVEQDGGDKIRVNLMYGKNETIDSISAYETINTDPQDGMTVDFFDWCIYTGAISISEKEKAQNSGKPRIQKLLREKTKQTTMSWAERMNRDLWDITYAQDDSAARTTGNSSKNIISIPQFVQVDPTGTADPGTVDQSAEAWSQNRTKASATETTTTFKQLRQDMGNLRNTCSRGAGGAPTHYICDQVTYEAYVNGLDEKVRYNFKDKASVGFEHVSHLGSKVFWDVDVPDAGAESAGVAVSGSALGSGTIYMLNDKFMDLVILAGADFKPQGFRSPHNQLASTGLYMFLGQLVSNCRRKHGVLYNIDIAIVS